MTRKRVPVILRPDWQSADGAVQLYLGDCIEILPTFADGSIDFIFADPPYGINFNNNDMNSNWEMLLGRGTVPKEAYRPILNDGLEANELFHKSLLQWRRLLPAGACFCSCCGGPIPSFAQWWLWIEELFKFKQTVVWDKGSMGVGRHYRCSYETILVAQKPGAPCRFYDESKMIENIIRPGDYGIAKIIPAAGQHQTEKPPELAAHFIRLHSRKNHLVLDPFMGSGSTAIAAITEGRKFIGIELEERWFHHAVERLELALQTGTDIYYKRSVRKKLGGMTFFAV